MQFLEAFKRFSADYSVRSIEIHNLLTQGDRAMLEWSWQQVERQTGRVSQAEDAITQRWREYIDDVSA